MSGNVTTRGAPSTSALRRRMGWRLTILVTGIYFGFLSLGITAPHLLAEPLQPGGTLNLAMALTLGVAAAAIGLTAYYVYWANGLSTLVCATMLTLLVLPSSGHAQAAHVTGRSNATAVVLFFVVILSTLAITCWAARHTRSVQDFYAAGGRITALQNGLAIAGDYMSAAAFLGLTALIYATGFDGIIYAIGFVVGWPIMVFVVAERLRALGTYTFADAIAGRLSAKPTRIVAACGTLTVISFYLVAQMVGAGQLIRLLFGLDYTWSVIIVGALMICYVAFGGMLATTWVQIIKAVLLLGGAGYMSIMVLVVFGFDLGALMAEAARLHQRGGAILAPQALAQNPISALSLGMGLMLGTIGLPHILMRFFTVKDAAAARQSVLWATLLIVAFFLMVIVMGFGAVVLLASNPAYLDAQGALIGGGNTAALHLAHAIGGDVLLGMVSAVAFATILAVVAGLTLSGASAVSHDLYANVFRRGAHDEAGEVRVSRIAAIAIGAVAVVLGIAFEHQNIAYMVGLAFSIAASANFPVLILAMYWSGLTTRGAVVGAAVGLGSSVLLTILGPAIWVKVIGFAAPVFPIDPPTIVTTPLALLCCWLVSVLDRSAQATRDREVFMALEGVRG
jgi:cation/acetate symporter